MWNVRKSGLSTILNQAGKTFLDRANPNVAGFGVALFYLGYKFAQKEKGVNQLETLFDL